MNTAESKTRMGCQACGDDAPSMMTPRGWLCADCRAGEAPQAAQSARPAPNAMYSATPAKLRDGSWGAKIHHASQPVKVGDSVAITASSGKSWRATVSRVIWASGMDAIVATER
jgi:hypothetical protein